MLRYWKWHCACIAVVCDGPTVQPFLVLRGTKKNQNNSVSMIILWTTRATASVVFLGVYYFYLRTLFLWIDVTIVFAFWYISIQGTLEKQKTKRPLTELTFFALNNNPRNQNMFLKTFCTFGGLKRTAASCR